MNGDLKVNPQCSVFTARGSDILEQKKGGGRLTFLGLPFFLVGLFVAQIPFGIIPVELEAGPLVMAILFPLGPLFAAVGFTLMLSRSGLTINRETREVTHWWGLLIPMKKNKHNFDHFTRVRIEFREGDRNSPDTFLISLIGSGLKTEDSDFTRRRAIHGYEYRVRWKYLCG